MRSELSEDTIEKCQKEVNGDNEKMFLLLTVIFSYKWK